MESVEEVKRKRKEKENRYGKRYGKIDTSMMRNPQLTIFIQTGIFVTSYELILRITFQSKSIYT